MGELQKRRAKLKSLYESGVLDEAEYQAMVADLELRVQVESGAVAIGREAKALGEGAVDAAGATIWGSIITGNVYHGEPTQDPAEALRIYCQVLAQSSGQLPLRGVDIGASDPAGQPPLGLAHVYINLDTQTQVKRETAGEKTTGRESILIESKETRPLSALEAASGRRRLVLTGDPGGGKSTFVNHLAHCLAAHAVRPDEDWLAAIPHWPSSEAETIPLLIVLRDFAHNLPDPLPGRAEPHHLQDFIRAQLRQQNLDFAWEPLRQVLETGRALLLFDGLDEVATASQRAFVRDAVLAFVKRYHARNRALVTCRILAYQPPVEADQPDLRLPEEAFPKFELAPFDEEKIDHFITAWYAELARLGQVRAQDAEGMVRKLRTAVRRPDLWRLAGNPLLLTVMALVHAHKGHLPDARALLYEDVIEMLLWRWDQVKTGGAAEAAPLRQLLLAAGRTDLDLKKTLWRLAYEAHAGAEDGDDGDQLAGIGELALKKALVKLASDDWNWAHQVVQTMKLRAGLLLERSPGVFTFPHRTFQEYLAGAHLSVQRNFSEEATNLARQGALWREAILLAAGRLVYVAGDTTDKPLALVNRLCPTPVVDDEVAWRNAWLAGDVLLEMGLKWAEEDAWGQELLARVRQRLVTLLTGGKLSPRERAEAGSTLARLGDPRPGVCTLEPELLDIPAGPFLMGDERHEIYLDTFAVARYPVTNAQYRFFVEDGGCSEKWRDCWTEEGWEYHEQYNWREPRWWDDERYNQENQPVVGVSWYEAVAYCNWLSRTTGRPYRLPTEAEWERAARHSDGRRYPWGEEWSEEAANAKETGIDRPAAVGIFPAGTAMCGAEDMSGNVWEWCSTRYNDEEDKPYTMPYAADDGREEKGGARTLRILRGGTYWNDYDALRCAARLRHGPNARLDFIGFRVVSAPSPSGL